MMNSKAARTILVSQGVKVPKVLFANENIMLFCHPFLLEKVY